MKLSEAKVKVRVWTGVMGIVLFAGLGGLLFSCQNNPKQPMGLENMPEFEQKFPQKSVWVHHHVNDSTEIAFSSMEEAEWKLVHLVPNCSCEDFVKILLSDPSSMDYPFSSFFEEDIFPPVYSDDSLVRCIGLQEHASFETRVVMNTLNVPYQPMMLIQYRLNGKVGLADKLKQNEDFYYSLKPDTIFTFNTNQSALYLVWGYSDDTCAGDSYRLRAYELDSVGLHPAFVFEKEYPESYGLGNEQSLFTVVGECYKTDNDVDLKSLVFFDKKESAMYIREFRIRERLESGCSPYLTDNYWKYIWNGEKFMLKNDIKAETLLKKRNKQRI